MLPIEGYGPIRRQALEDARLQELAYPPVPDQAVQDRLEKAGLKVLDQFPVDTKGYDYVFKVLHSEIANAHALPTGFVFVTDKLMEAMEDSLELELVLAHEITHTELNHHPDEGWITGLVAPEILRRLEQRRFEETEADLLAVCYLARAHGTSGTLERARRALSKIQFSEETPPGGTGAFSTYPSFRDRLDFFDPHYFTVADNRTSFCGLDDNGQVLVRVNLIGRLKDRDPKAAHAPGAGFADDAVDVTPYTVYFLVQATDLVNDPIKRAGGEMEGQSGNKSRFLKSDLLFPISPGDAGVVGLRVERGDASVLSPRSLELDLTGQIDRWVSSQR